MKGTEEAGTLSPDWSPYVRFIRLACPKCGVSVEVVQGCEGWCSRCPGRPQMEESAT
jgi:hypothetical protein